jgi:hypothetical protein
MIEKGNNMNKRIEQLAEQCGFRSNPDVYDRNQSFDIEKFAQLIVQECISQIDSQCFLTHSNEWIQKAAWNAYICAIIKQHFGDES